MTDNKEKKVVFAKCRRGSDPATQNQVCQSNQAYNMSEQGDSMVRLECIKCKYAWVVTVGGSMKLPNGC